MPLLISSLTQDTIIQLLKKWLCMSTVVLSSDLQTVVPTAIMSFERNISTNSSLGEIL